MGVEIACTEVSKGIAPWSLEDGTGVVIGGVVHGGGGLREVELCSVGSSVWRLRIFSMLRPVGVGLGEACESIERAGTKSLHGRMRICESSRLVWNSRDRILPLLSFMMGFIVISVYTLLKCGCKGYLVPRRVRRPS